MRVAPAPLYNTFHEVWRICPNTRCPQMSCPAALRLFLRNSCSSVCVKGRSDGVTRFMSIKQPKVLKRWKTLSACNAGRSSKTAEPPSHCPNYEENANSSVTPARNGRRSTLTTDHHNHLEDEGPQLLGIGTEPEFARGQRALLLQSPGGNLLWDCISLLNNETIADVNALGGIRAIAISHHVIYSSMIRNGPSALTPEYFCIRPIANGSCVPQARDRAFNSGKDQPCHFGMG